MTEKVTLRDQLVGLLRSYCEDGWRAGIGFSAGLMTVADDEIDGLQTEVKRLCVANEPQEWTAFDRFIDAELTEGGS